MTLLSLTLSSFANEAEKMTRIAEVLNGGVLLQKQESAVFKCYKYRFDRTRINNLEGDLSKFLGPDWSKNEFDKRAFDGMKRSMKERSRVILDTYSVFINKKIPGSEIVLMVTDEDWENDQFRTVFLSWKSSK